MLRWPMERNSVLKHLSYRSKRNLNLAGISLLCYEADYEFREGSSGTSTDIWFPLFTHVRANHKWESPGVARALCHSFRRKPTRGDETASRLFADGARGLPCGCVCVGIQRAALPSDRAEWRYFSGRFGCGEDLYPARCPAHWRRTA